MPPWRAHKIASPAGKRPRDHSSHAVRSIEQLSSNFAHAVQLGDGNHVFMRRDLKNTVARRVDNGPSGSHMFFAKFLDDLRSRCRLVADGPAPYLFLKRFDNFARESVRVHWKCLIKPNARHFPMSCSGIFSRRSREALSKRSEERR